MRLRCSQLLISFVLFGATAYGMQEQRPPLLFFALQRAIEADGFDAVWRCVDTLSYRDFAADALNIHGGRGAHIPVAFKWREVIKKSDPSPVVQELFEIVSQEGKRAKFRGTTFCRVIEPYGALADDGDFCVVVRGSSKQRVLNMLQQLKPR